MYLAGLTGGLTKDRKELIKGKNLLLEMNVQFSNLINENNGGILINFEWIIINLLTNSTELRVNEVQQLKSFNRQSSILIKKALIPSEYSKLLGYTYGVRCSVSLIGFGGFTVQDFYDSPRMLVTNLSFFNLLKE